MPDLGILQNAWTGIEAFKKIEVKLQVKKYSLFVSTFCAQAPAVAHDNTFSAGAAFGSTLLFSRHTSAMFKTLPTKTGLTGHRPIDNTRKKVEKLKRLHFNNNNPVLKQQNLTKYYLVWKQYNWKQCKKNMKNQAFQFYAKCLIKPGKLHLKDHFNAKWRLGFGILQND